MRKTVIFSIACFSVVSFLAACGNKDGKATGGNTKSEAAKTEAADRALAENRAKLDKLNQDYPRMPTDGTLLVNGPDNPVYQELEHRYETDLAELKKNVEGTGAKMVAILLSVHKNDKEDLSEKYGTPYVKSVCTKMGLEYFDFGPVLAAHDEKEIKQVPKDAHWTKVGAKLIADNIAPFIKKYASAASTVVYKDTERPETFGDLPPNDDEVLDGGKDLPYHVKANAQGVRMDHNLTFPKKKKRVLLLGDSGFYCPFLDNEFTIASVLQQQFPDYEIYAVAGISWTLTDFISMWNEKVKFTEPDIVILGTNGNDIEDLFFTHCNHFSRNEKPTYPSPVEEKYYQQMYRQ